MIGQEYLLKQIDNLIEKGFPRFVVITGQKGQGKTELVKYISKKLKYSLVEFGIKIDEIREMIEMAYKQTEPIIYLIQNADKMSLNAKNSLLKLVEEPPQRAYIIMELQQIENTLETIKSRCQEIKMESYTERDICDFLSDIPVEKADLDDRKIISHTAQNKYQIDLLIKYKPKEFFDYVDKVYNNIYKVQSANSFKIAEKIDLKDTGEGYDLEMFWNMYIYRCIGELFDLMAYPGTEERWAEANIVGKCISITEKYKQKLSINGINKSFLIDRLDT